MSRAPFKVFISYSHKDDALRTALEEHLAQLKRERAIEIWQDLRILPGQEWKREILEALEAADIVLLLISPPFLASDFCYVQEMGRALERHEESVARVLPILLRPCEWESSPFAKLQLLPDGARPITKWRPRDDGYLRVAQGLRRVIADLSKRSLPAEPQRSSIFMVPHRRNPFFTGREKELERLAQQLSTTGKAALGQVAAISGLGGIGKTQTAIEFAYHHREEYFAVFFVGAETETDLNRGFAAIAKELKLPEAEDADQQLAVQATKLWLETKSSWLLILDNADDPDLLKPFLPVAPRGHVIVTSRARNFAAIGARAEQLGTPTPADADLFLLERAGRQDTTGIERQAAHDLAKALGNLPLALEQAAAYVAERQASFVDYLASFQRRGALELLSQGKVEAGSHQPVAVTWSINIE